MPLAWFYSGPRTAVCLVLCWAEGTNVSDPSLSLEKLALTESWQRGQDSCRHSVIGVGLASGSQEALAEALSQQ